MEFLFGSLRYVGRVAGRDEGEVERLYEERQKRKATESSGKPREDDDGLEVDPVDALPTKTLQGELVYNRGKPLDTQCPLLIITIKSEFPVT